MLAKMSTRSFVCVITLLISALVQAVSMLDASSATQVFTTADASPPSCPNCPCPPKSQPPKPPVQRTAERSTHQTVVYCQSTEHESDRSHPDSQEKPKSKDGISSSPSEAQPLPPYKLSFGTEAFHLGIESPNPLPVYFLLVILVIILIISLFSALTSDEPKPPHKLWMFVTCLAAVVSGLAGYNYFRFGDVTQCIERVKATIEQADFQRNVFQAVESKLREDLAEAQGKVTVLTTDLRIEKARNESGLQFGTALGALGAFSGLILGLILAPFLGRSLAHLYGLNSVSRDKGKNTDLK